METRTPKPEACMKAEIRTPKNAGRVGEVLADFGFRISAFGLRDPFAVLQRLS
jgi:hypothetical protein